MPRVRSSSHEQGRVGLARHGIADAEPGVAVPAVDALADHLESVRQVGVELGAPRVRDAVHGPDPPVLLEVGCARRVPVLCVDDEGAGRAGGRSISR